LKERVQQWANLPLTPCHLTAFNQYYYAIGNSSVISVFYCNISSAFEIVKLIESESWRYQNSDPQFESILSQTSKQPTRLWVLCLACRDLRNILFSLTGLDKSKKGQRADKIDIVVNDFDVHVLTRNILILNRIFDEMVNEAIFSIWFSTALIAKQYSYLRRCLHQLINNTNEPKKASSQ